MTPTDFPEAPLFRALLLLPWVAAWLIYDDTPVVLHVDTPPSPYVPGCQDGFGEGMAACARQGYGVGCSGWVTTR